MRQINKTKPFSHGRVACYCYSPIYWRSKYSTCFFSTISAYGGNRFATRLHGWYVTIFPCHQCNFTHDDSARGAKNTPTVTRGDFWNVIMPLRYGVGWGGGSKQISGARDWNYCTPSLRLSYHPKPLSVVHTGPDPSQTFLISSSRFPKMRIQLRPH